MARVFKGRVKNWGNLDYVTLWFAKARDYALATDAPFAFVATNSIVQGVQVPELWPHLLEGLEIRFAHRSFKWSNLAAHNAGVTCVIVGMGRPSNAPKRLFDGDTVRDVEVIGPYLAPGTTAIVAKASKPLAPDLEPMVFGNKPTDGGNLILDRNERDALLLAHPEAARFVRRLYGSQELMKGIERYCLWVGDDEVEEAKDHSRTRHGDSKPWRGTAPRRTRRTFRSRSQTDRIASCNGRAQQTSHTIMVPAITSEDRVWLPVEVMDIEISSTIRSIGIFDGAIWQAPSCPLASIGFGWKPLGDDLKSDPMLLRTLSSGTPSLCRPSQTAARRTWRSTGGRSTRRARRRGSAARSAISTSPTTCRAPCAAPTKSWTRRWRRSSARAATARTPTGSSTCYNSTRAWRGRAEAREGER